MTNDELFAKAREKGLHVQFYSASGLIPDMHSFWVARICDRDGNELGGEGNGKTRKEAAIAAMRDHFGVGAPVTRPDQV